MEILDITKEQIILAEQRKLFENYRDFFEKFIEFVPKDQNYFQATRKRVEQLDENFAQKWRDRIEEVVKEKVDPMQREIDTEHGPGQLFLSGTIFLTTTQSY